MRRQQHLNKPKIKKTMKMKEDKLQELADFLGEQELKLKQILKKETKDDILTELCKPIMKFLAENYHPHMKIIIERDFAELVELKERTKIIDDFIC